MSRPREAAARADNRARSDRTDGTLPIARARVPSDSVAPIPARLRAPGPAGLPAIPAEPTVPILRPAPDPSRSPSSRAASGRLRLWMVPFLLVGCGVTLSGAQGPTAIMAPMPPGFSAAPPPSGKAMDHRAMGAMEIDPRPTKWMPSAGRQCHRYRSYYACDGPLRVALPHGEAARRAKLLGLGSREAAETLLGGAPPEAWIAAIPSAIPAASSGAVPEGIDAAADGSRTGDADAVSTEADSLLWPVEGARLWRGWGTMRGGRRFSRHVHRGLDIGAAQGTPMRSVADGLVAYSQNGVNGYGNLMLIVHRDGSVGLYAHNHANYVFAGQIVRRGQVIGEVGHTGLARGSHLHFEWRVRGRPRNPIRRMVGRTDGRRESSRG